MRDGADCCSRTFDRTFGAYLLIALSLSLSQYGVLGPSIEERVVFCTAAMHSFVHGWFCQLHFAPRFKKALGLTDGEGVERLWSRLCKLIPILRHVHVRMSDATGDSLC